MKSLYSYANALRLKYRNDPDGLAQYLANFYFVYPGLPDEVFSGMDEYSSAHIRQRFLSKLPYNTQIQIETGSANMLWPPSTHDAIIQTAFNILDKNHLKSIETGSRRIDHESLTVPTLLEENAPQHAMTPKKKVDELKSVEKAKEWARNEAKKFVSNCLNKAKTDYQKAIEGSRGTYTYWITRAYEFFGEACHPIMDNWSPAHRDFQIYDGSALTKGAMIGGAIGSLGGPIGTVIGAGIGGYMTTTEHSKIEKRAPTQDELNSMIDEMRLAYRMTFNETGRAIKDSDMQATDRRASELKGMLIR